jgi:hypothetical protein
MIGDPDRPPPRPGGRRAWPGKARRPQQPVVPHVRRVDPSRYVGRLLLWQGMAWVALAGLGLGFWITALPATLTATTTGTFVIWRAAQLLAIVFGAGLGAAEIWMACRIGGGPRLTLAMAFGVQGATLAAVLVLAAIGIMIVGSVLELLALSGALLLPLARPQEPRRAGSRSSPNVCASRAAPCAPDAHTFFRVPRRCRPRVEPSRQIV